MSTSTISSPIIPFAEFQQQFKALLQQPVLNQIQAYQFFELQPHDLPWQGSGLQVEAGQAVSFFVAGYWYLVEALNLTLEPSFVFWARTTFEEPMYSPPSHTGTHQFTQAGEIMLARSAGEWASTAGDLLVPPEKYTEAKGHVYGLIIVWKADPLVGLQALQQQGDVNHLLGHEIQRLQQAISPPKQWNYYPLLGNRETFQTCQHGQGVCCHTNNNVGILQYPVDMALTEGVTLDWRWVIDSLPSSLAEDTLPTHDYLSIAVEFDDGQDLTYLWSVELPLETVFRCPIPSWTARETHLVVRTGLSELGKAKEESRDVYTDYHAHIAGPAKRIVSIWLIAVSIFQHSKGQCRYEQIVLRNAEAQVTVLAIEQT